MQMIFHKFSCGPLGTNAILLACPLTKTAAVIDPSLGSAQLILERAQGLSLEIKKILLTHSHWDHIADAYLLKQKTGAAIYVHPLDAPNLEHPGSDQLPLFFPIHGVEPDFFAVEGERIFVGKLACEVIHTPGHTPGGVCYYFREQKILFSGDTLFEGGIGNLHLPTGEPLKMKDSLAKLAQLPPETHVVPGHGKDTSIAKEEKILNRR